MERGRRQPGRGLGGDRVLELTVGLKRVARALLTAALTLGGFDVGQMGSAERAGGDYRGAGAGEELTTVDHHTPA